jgi:hypothetical protein
MKFFTLLLSSCRVTLLLPVYDLQIPSAEANTIMKKGVAFVYHLSRRMRAVFNTTMNTAHMMMRGITIATLKISRNQEIDNILKIFEKTKKRQLLSITTVDSSRQEWHLWQS